MSSNLISPSVREFISRHVRTVKDLEVLLLLVERSQVWTAAGVGEVMYITEEAAERILGGLVESNLVHRSITVPATYRYDPANGSDTVVRELASDYSRMRVRVIEMIYRGPDDSLTSFADAFKF